jgi:hypothetical protein
LGVEEVKDVVKDVVTDVIKDVIKDVVAIIDRYRWTPTVLCSDHSIWNFRWPAIERAKFYIAFGSRVPNCFKRLAMAPNWRLLHHRYSRGHEVWGYKLGETRYKLPSFDAAIHKRINAINTRYSVTTIL